mmetsp:Transcript_32032/g.77823  ORF Transcript_32032/g.77823 Transcript_32032/m.77823 type:complete len:986 (+) Transcript_32032:157-3114(+)
MDIRNFFGAKKTGGSKSKSSSSSSSKKEGGSKRKPPSNQTTAGKKQKQQIEDDAEVKEISPTDFFANDNNKNKKKSSKLATPEKKVTKPEAKPKAPTPKKLDEKEDSSDDEPVRFIKTTTPEKKSKEVVEVDSDDKDEDYEDEVKDVTPKKKPPSRSTRTSAASSPAKRTRSASPKKASPPKKQKQAPPPKKEKMPILEATLEKDSFDVDSSQVPEFLQGLTFVFTGILENLNRDDAMDLVKMLGGRVTTAVSSKTSYLIAGSVLEDGRPYTEGSKFDVALEKEVKVVLGEKKLYGLCHLYHERAKKEKGITDAPPASSKPAAAASNPYAKKAVTNPYVSKSSTAVSNPYVKKAPVSNPYAKKAVATNPYAKKVSSTNPYAKSKDQSSTSEVSKSSNDPNQLWADRHAPSHSRDILGNKEKVIKLQRWLGSWERQFNNPAAAKKTWSKPGGPWKAALLSGPPGIGKTTSATLVATEAGRDLLEFNASDVRSKKALQNGLGDLTGSQALNFGPAANKGKKKPPKKLRCIIMDEVDGMGAGDRSGMAELIQMIKKSKVPIICICNDRQSQKMKSLLPYCMDLRFSRPNKSTMANRILRVAKSEGMEVERNAAEAIAESCGNDVRQVMNCLQMWAQKKSQDGTNEKLTYKGLKDRQNAINKDEILRVSLFDAAKTILEGRKGLAGASPKAELNSLFRRTDAFFVDYSFTGLLVQQNYLKVLTGQRKDVIDIPDKEHAYLERVHDAAASMSDYAFCEHEIRSGDLNWSLLPACSVLAVKTGYHAGGEEGGFLPSFPEFTAWLGKNSSKGKKQRMLDELHYHMNFKISGDSQELRQNYLPVLRQHMFSIFKDGSDAAGIISLMDEYGLSREDVFEKIDEFRMGKKVPAFSDLDSKQKAAFTREYNKGAHKSQALVAEQGGPPGRKKKGAKRERDPADLDAIDEDGDFDQESDDDDEAELKKLQEKFKKKGRKGKGAKKGAAKKTTKRGKK